MQQNGEAADGESDNRESDERRTGQMPLTAGQAPNPLSEQLTSATDELPNTMDPGPSFMQLNDTKAGMTGLDKERINQTILEASKNSPFFKRQQEKQKVLDAQIADLLTRKSKLTKEQLKCAEAQMDLKAAELVHRRRDMSRIIAHMDMDMFFAAVEMRDDPQLADVPLAVGSNAMLSTSNYAARKFGVRAGMAGFIARSLCPNLVIKPVDMVKYQSVSREVMSVVADYDPNYRSASVDEAYMDLTDYVLHKYDEAAAEDPLLVPVPRNVLSFPKSVWNMAADVVNEMRKRIEQKTGLTCSAGIAHNKMIAKVCSDINKPNGQFLLDASCQQTVDSFVADMRVRKIGGIGQVQEQLLKALGIETCRDLFAARGLIQLLFTPANISFYLNVSLGVGSNNVAEWDDAKRKSLSSETTFKATKDIKILNKHLADLSSVVSADLRKEQLMGKTITLIIKWATFVSNDRSKSLPFTTSDEQIIRETVQCLLQQAVQKKPDAAIRLLGVRVSNFADDITASRTSSSAPPAKKSKSSSKQKQITEFVKPIAAPAAAPFSLSSRLHDHHDFVCVYCLMEFVDESSLEDHLNERACPGLPPQSLSCPVCDSPFPDYPQLNLHLDQDHFAE